MREDVHVHIHLGVEESRVEALEEQMVSVESELNDLKVAVDEWIEDIAARVEALEAAQGEFTPEGQAAFDALKASVDAGVAATGDADGDGTPPAPEPEPVP